MATIVDTRIAALEADIERWRQHDWMHSMSDDFWYSNGGHDAALNEISTLERKIEEIRACHADR